MHTTLDNLTPRQREILALVAKGYSNRQIAKQLSISPATVKGHLRILYQDLNIPLQEEGVYFPRMVAARWYWEQMDA